uniref:Putative secreted protein n=1 Tax=Anopheles darlingi TaxID=43151 RepID=A0A2M4DQQ2_ANODA
MRHALQPRCVCVWSLSVAHTDGPPVYGDRLGVRVGDALARCNSPEHTPSITPAPVPSVGRALVAFQRLATAATFGWPATNSACSSWRIW